jgi:hypothetical protein
MKNEIEISSFQRFLMKNAVVQLYKFISNTIRILAAVKRI